MAQCSGKTGYDNSRILWIKLKFSRVKFCVVLWYGPNDGGGEERDRFLNNMDRTLDSVGNGYKFCTASPGKPAGIPAGQLEINWP